MTRVYCADYVQEFKNTGVLLMRHTQVLCEPTWILVIPIGEATMYSFKTIHYMACKNNKIVMFTSSSDKHSYYEISIDDNDHNIITLDLYEWLREKVCLNPSSQPQTCPS